MKKMIDKKIYRFKSKRKGKRKKKFGIKNKKINKFYIIIALCILYFAFLTKQIFKNNKTNSFKGRIFIVLYIIMKRKWHIFLYGDYIIMLINL